MTERNQAEEMTRAADKFAEAARDLAGSLDRFLEFHQATMGGETYVWTEKRRELRREPLSDEDAVALALRAEREVRKEKAQSVDWEQEERHPTPTPEDVRRRQEDRRGREAENDA